jgi:hypothetical protein
VPQLATCDSGASLSSPRKGRRKKKDALPSLSHSVALAHTSTAPAHSLSLTFFFLSAAFRSVGFACSAFFLCATGDPVLLT